MSDVLLQLIKTKSKSKKSLENHVKYAKGRMLFNKNARCMAAEHLKQLKVDMKVADATGDYEAASACRLAINAYRSELSNLVVNRARTTKFIQRTYADIHELQSQIVELDAVYEANKTKV